MKKTIISAILLFVFFTNISAKKITIKGEVRDEYGRAVGNISISTRDAAKMFGDNRFELEVNDNDTLHFELDDEDKKDTVLSDPEVYHIIKVKLSAESSDSYYASFPPNFQDKKFSINNFIDKNLLYPEDALKDSISGVAHVRFRLNEYGERDHYSVRSSICQSLDQEAIRLVSLMPKMLPIRNGNKYKVSNCFIPIKFNINDYLLSKKNSAKTTSDSTEIQLKEFKTLSIIRMPEFPGGTEKLISFISKNLTYPQDAIRKNVSAKVILRFLVDYSGNIKDITIIQSAYPELDEEAIRVVKKMPRWIPGEEKRDNKTYASAVIYTLPIQFKMQ